MEYKEPDVSRVTLFNQSVWDNFPERASEEIASAIVDGGFGEDCIRREVGNYEGQVMAIRRGLVSWDGQFYWIINDAGKAFLSAQEKPVPHFLPMLDSWHMSRTEYCAHTLKWTGLDSKVYGPYLRIAKEVRGRAGSVAMMPLLSAGDVLALRDFLNAWLAENKKTVELERRQ
jgi:hypothetical protein